MSRKESINSSIDMLKKLIMAIMTALFGIFSYIVINIETITTLQTIGILVGVLGLLISGGIFVKFLLKLHKELEEIE